MKKSLFLTTRIAVFLSFSMLMMQCSKDEETPQTAADKIIGSWLMTADTYSPAYDYFGSGQLITEAFPLYDACEKDNLLIFKTNSEGVFDESALKCDPSDPQTIPFLWTITTNGTVLNISAIADLEIAQLDGTTLKLKTTFVESGVTYTNTLSFTKK